MSHMRRRGLFLALIVLAAIPIGAAQQAATAVGSPLRVLRGVVTADAGAPLQRVRVLVSATGLSADPVFTNDVALNGGFVPVNGRGAVRDQAGDATQPGRSASVRGRVRGPDGRPVGGSTG